MTGRPLNLPIVVACYNRPESLKRVLSSLLAADYPDDPVDLIISVDCSDIQSTLIELAEAFDWPVGTKTVRAFKERQGLRSHILQCGDLSVGRDGIIVLEDDLLVGEDFYRYVAAAVAAVGSDDAVAGISLYAPMINEMVSLPFQPAPSGFDAYYLQSSQSWGQCWTASMWAAFRDWYEAAATPLITGDDMPGRIYSWPETSWKKYHMKFTVETGRTWLYPYISHSSNSAAIGTHARRPSFMYQVPLSSGRSDFVFPPREDSAAVHYDVFFERSGLVDDDGTPLLLDLYGSRRSIPQGCRFVTNRDVSLVPLRGYGLSLRPQDENVARNIVGDDFFAYYAAQPVTLSGRATIRQRVYHSSLTWMDALRVGAYGFRQAVPDQARRVAGRIWAAVAGRRK